MHVRFYNKYYLFIYLFINLSIHPSIHRPNHMTMFIHSLLWLCVVLSLFIWTSWPAWHRNNDSTNNVSLGAGLYVCLTNGTEITCFTFKSAYDLHAKQFIHISSVPKRWGCEIGERQRNISHNDELLDALVYKDYKSKQAEFPLLTLL